MNDAQTIQEPAAIPAIWQATRAMGFSMASDPLTCAFLRTLAAAKPGGRFLELGSGTGLSTAWLLDGMCPASTLTTVDYDEQALGVLRGQLGHDPRLTVVCSDGDAFVHALQGQEFDFMFADTWAGKYQLLDEALALLNPGGIYVIDDMLPQPNWPQGHAQKAAALMDRLETHPDLVVSRLSWASGVIVAVKRG